MKLQKPTISDFTLSPHNHSNAANGGNVDSLTYSSVYYTTTAPTSDNDVVDTAGIGKKFNYGSRWIVTTNKDEYECISPSNPAIWKKISGTPVPVTVNSGVVTIDANLTGNRVWNYLDLNTDGNIILQTPVNGYDGQFINLKIRQHATSSKTVTLSGNIRQNQIALDVSSTLNSTTYTGFVCDISGATAYYDLVSQIYTA